MKNLIKDLQQLTSLDIPDIKQCLLERLEYEYDREPESSGMVYDNWNDRVADLEDICELLEDDDADLSEIKDMIYDFQLIHGGLSRLKIGKK